MPINDLAEDDLKRLYGHSAQRTPADAARFFADYPGTWWIAGGWAIEAFSGVERPHGDLDPSVPRSELPLLRRHFADRLDLWIADRGTLTPLRPEDDPDGPHEKVLPEECENLWARPSGDEPWEYDIILMAVDHETWVFKRDGRIRLPLADILWQRDGVNYLRPEIQLLHKAARLRPKDQLDFDAVRPRLEAERRDWLRAALELVHPRHPWITGL